MYYCEPCRAELRWPKSLAQSYGTCEICRRTGTCFDMPHKDLPARDPQPATNKDGIMAAKTAPRYHAPLDTAFHALYPQVALLYQATERFYHNRQHLDSMLYQAHQWLGVKASSDAERYDYQVVRMAILYHDAHYQTMTPGFNEEQSAQMFKHQFQVLIRNIEGGGMVSDAFVPDVVNCIRATGRHMDEGVGLTRAMHWVLDIDLHELGTTRYRINNYNLLKEAEAVGDIGPVEYVLWHLNFAVKLLTKRHIFYNAAMQAKYEVAARLNLRRTYSKLWHLMSNGEVVPDPHDENGLPIAPSPEDVNAWRAWGITRKERLMRDLRREPAIRPSYL